MHFHIYCENSQNGWNHLNALWICFAFFFEKNPLLNSVQTHFNGELWKIKSRHKCSTFFFKFIQSTFRCCCDYEILTNCGSKRMISLEKNSFVYGRVSYFVALPSYSHRMLNWTHETRIVLARVLHSESRKTINFQAGTQQSTPSKRWKKHTHTSYRWAWIIIIVMAHIKSFNGKIKTETVTLFP